MTRTSRIANHLRQVFFGGNWSSSCLEEVLAPISFEKATQVVGSHNTIATLLFHIDYYVRAQLGVLHLGVLTAHDRESMACPPIRNESDWKTLISGAMRNAEALAKAIENLPDSQLDEIFVKDKYGTYERNFLGLIEHSHYHLGQIALLRKLLKN